MQIRGSPNGARHSPPHLSPPGRDRSERVVVFNWKGWSPSIGTGGRHQSVRPPVTEPTPNSASDPPPEMPGDPQSDAPLFDGESLAKVPLEAQIGQKRKM